MRRARTASRSEVEVEEDEARRFLVPAETVIEVEERQRTNVKEVRRRMTCRKLIGREDRVLHNFKASIFVFSAFHSSRMAPRSAFFYPLLSFSERQLFNFII